MSVRRRALCGLLAAALVALGAAEDALLPEAPAVVIELHGQWHGERFWARLGAADAGGRRRLELVYTPPPPSAVGGAQLVDCPFLILDHRLRILQWDGRDSLQGAVYREGAYRITREIERLTDDGKDRTPDAEARRIAMPLGWDERLAPLLLALIWQSGSQGDVGIADFFGPPGPLSRARWQDREVWIAGRRHEIEPDGAGRLARLRDAAARPLLLVAQRSER
ncbi:MAG: hypothetical protein RMM29_03025 [Planctomycetota bacterium]|nr:hypothetical protein [Planctomycetota bacterium]